jgi:two-component system sensor histidine kinase KdpD
VTLEAGISSKAVSLRVTDNGPGIPDDLLPHVFEKFVHARNRASEMADGGEGTGLGLTIAKGIMDAHGGSITAVSPVAQGRGTRIVLTFPRDETPS